MSSQRPVRGAMTSSQQFPELLANVIVTHPWGTPSRGCCALGKPVSHDKDVAVRAENPDPLAPAVPGLRADQPRVR